MHDTLTLAATRDMLMAVAALSGLDRPSLDHWSRSGRGSSGL